MQGDFELCDQIDTSHPFLYGHRYWKTVKAAIEAEAIVFTDQTHSLNEEVKQIGMLVAEKLKVERPLINAIVAVGLMTLNQVGIEALKAATGETEKPSGDLDPSSPEGELWLQLQLSRAVMRQEERDFDGAERIYSEIAAVTGEGGLGPVYHQLGIDTNRATVTDLTGRPHYLVDSGAEPIRELI